MAHPGGRPRTTSFPPEEMIKLGEEMIDWVKKNNPLHLSEWYSVHKGFIYKDWKAFIQLPEFLPYYEKAINIVGRQYLDKNSNIREGVSQRFLRFYFRDLKEEEDEKESKKIEKEKQMKIEILKEEIRLRKELENTAVPNDKIIELEQKNLELEYIVKEKTKMIQELLEKIG